MVNSRIRKYTLSVVLGYLAVYAIGSYAKGGSTVNAANSALVAQEIVSQVLNSYRAMPRYCETVTGTERRLFGSGKVKSEVWFLGSGDFFVLLTDEYLGRIQEAQFLAKNDKYYRWTAKEGVRSVDSLTTMEMSIFGTSIGGYGFAGSWTTGLLLGRVTNKRKIYGLTQSIERLQDEAIDGTDALILRGRHSDGLITKFWITKKNFLIQKIVLQSPSEYVSLVFTRCKDVNIQIPDTLPSRISS
jgi:hypothetical protein